VAYETFTGKGGGADAKKWQRASKKSQYSTKLAQGQTAEKKSFLKNLASDLSTIYGVVSGGVEGVLGAVGDKFASVQQDTAGNIFQNPGDTTKIPPMKKGGIVTYGSGLNTKNVMSGDKPVTWGAGPSFGGSGNHPATRGITQNSNISQALKNKGNALPSAISSRMQSGEAQEFLNSTNNVFAPMTRGSNPLLDFETQNYVITLSCVSQQQFNNGTYRNNPGVVIAKTGGKGRQGTGPLSYDYYIERLTVRSTVAPTPNAFATNAYQIFFDIQEPLGVDLIPALIQASLQQGYQNHLSAVYVIKIEFVGNDDNGMPRKIPGTTRYIPCRLFKVDLDIDEGGGRYNIQAAPYNYVQQLTSYDKLNESVVHTGTDVKTLVQNFFTGLNENYKVKKDEDKVVVKPHLYEFDISGSSADIIKSKLGFGDSGASANQAINVSPSGGPGGGDTASRKVTAQKGTSIVEYLTHVVQNSKFILNQFDASNDTKDEIFSTIKIMPSTEIMDVDNGLGEPQYKFTYSLRQQKIAVESTSVAPVRTYNYIYTGENKDVLNLDIKYQFAYFQPGRYYDAMQNKLKNDDDGLEEESTSNQGPSFNDASLGKGGTTASKVPTAQKSADTINPDAPAENREMADVFRQILEDPAADLIVVDLTILGDPYWIEQKTLNPGNNQMTSDGQTEPDGSVSPDANNIVVQLNARYPSDLNDDTGLMRLNLSAFFQGKFRVILCESNFEGGVFQQTITMTRFREQENDVKYTPAKGIASNMDIRRPDALGGSIDLRRPDALGKSTSNVIYKNKNNTGSNGFLSIDKIANNNKKKRKVNKGLRRLGL
tara:strand:- start:16529 stop:19003 length:2475 start_codon:yes stop_codon:yes gene_type:complete